MNIIDVYLIVYYLYDSVFNVYDTVVVAITCSDYSSSVNYIFTFYWIEFRRRVQTYI